MCVCVYNWIKNTSCENDRLENALTLYHGKGTSLSSFENV